MLRRCFFGILISAWLLGCDEPPEIRQYEVAKSRSDLGDIGEEPLVIRKTPVATPVATRMVVGILQRPDATWFFKLTGPVVSVDQSETEWKAWFSNIDIDDEGKPQWRLPSGWRRGPEKMMRFATLFVPVKDHGELEISISFLGPDQNLLDNVNRWLGQLDKPVIKEDELKLGSFDSTAGEMKIFDETGMMVLSDSPMMAPSRPRDVEFAHRAMDGWIEGSVNDIVKVRLKKGDEQTSPQLTVTQLPAMANEWVPNAARWARQVEMDDSEEVIRDSSEKITVDGIEGDKIRLVSSDQAKKFAMIGIMIEREDLAWFFKLIGDRENVIELEYEFDQFVKSFHFK